MLLSSVEVAKKGKGLVQLGAQRSQSGNTLKSCLTNTTVLFCGIFMTYKNQ
jgi:hypothetical protein